MELMRLHFFFCFRPIIPSVIVSNSAIIMKIGGEVLTLSLLFS